MHLGNRPHRSRTPTTHAHPGPGGRRLRGILVVLMAAISRSGVCAATAWMHATMARQFCSTAKFIDPGWSGSSAWLHSRLAAASCTPRSSRLRRWPLPVPASSARRCFGRAAPILFRYGLRSVARLWPARCNRCTCGFGGAAWLMAMVGGIEPDCAALTLTSGSKPAATPTTRSRSRQYSRQ